MVINKTKRPVSYGLEELLGQEFKCLDHGFIKVLDYQGNDDTIVQSARISTGSQSKSIEEDRRLINYLMRHRHTTPFEMCEIRLYMKLPIFVARQLIRHRMVNVNEYSARYSVLDNEFYVPELEHIEAQSTINNQGRSGELTLEQRKAVQELLRDEAGCAYGHYKCLLGEGSPNPEMYWGLVYEPLGKDDFPGIAKELARMNLSLNFYTQWYWKIDLHNLFHFLSLRADSHAQYEIRVYANAILEMVKAWVPLAYEAWLEHRFNAITLSATAWKLVKEIMREKILHDPLSIDRSESDIRDIFESFATKIPKRELDDLVDLIKVN